MTMLLALTRAQVIFSIGLAAIALLITGFTLFVAWTTVWGNRWYRKGGQR